MEKIKYFNGLNELRALAVIFSHVELFKFRDEIPSIFTFFNFFISHLGKNAVYLFFVLSGFLITYLLLIERDDYKQINFKKFYLRRIFRIWPLYYTIILLSFLIIPFLTNQFDYFESVPYYYGLITDADNYTWASKLLYVFMLPNFALKLGFVVPGASQAWSIGVEEQFYLLWPLLLFMFRRYNLLIIFCCFLLWPFIIYLKIWYNLPPVLILIVKSIPFHFLAIGSIGAFIYYHKQSFILRYTKNVPLSIFAYSGLILLLFVPLISNFLQSYLIGFVFLLLIFITIDGDNKSAIRNKYLNYLGKISFGIYMYHPFVMFLVFPFVNIYLKATSMVFYNMLTYTLVIGLTIIISHLSYHLMEKRFINIKNAKFKLVK